MESNKPTEFVMVVDPLPSSNLDINKYLKRHNFFILPDLNKENVAKVTCKHNFACPLLNELVMMKEFERDDRLYYDRELRKTEPTPVFIENGHITNLLYCKMADIKLFKEYMKEFKKRRRNWDYKAVVVKSNKLAKNAVERQMNDMIPRILKQAQIEYIVIKKFKDITFLRKNIFKQLEMIANPNFDLSKEEDDVD